LRALPVQLARAERRRLRRRACLTERHAARLARGIERPTLAGQLPGCRGGLRELVLRARQSCRGPRALAPELRCLTLEVSGPQARLLGAHAASLEGCLELGVLRLALLDLALRAFPLG